MNWDEYYAERDREANERIRRDRRREMVENLVFGPLAIVSSAFYIVALILLGF